MYCLNKFLLVHPSVRPFTYIPYKYVVEFAWLMCIIKLTCALEWLYDYDDDVDVSTPYFALHNKNNQTENVDKVHNIFLYSHSLPTRFLDNFTFHLTPPLLPLLLCKQEHTNGKGSVDNNGCDG